MKKAITVSVPKVPNVKAIGTSKVTLRSAIRLTALFIATLAVAPHASAVEFQCEVPGDTRYIRVDIPGENHLCEVSVTHENTGVREVKWHADNDSLFCSARAYQMVEKYRSTWNYDCSAWPDRDGIDLLSPTQRLILDQRILSLATEGREAQPPFTIQSVKATASTPLDKQPGKLALQFFTNTGDFTEIIDDQTYSWKIETTIVDLASQINGGQPLEYALINAIDNSSTLEVFTQLTEDNAACYGSQLLSTIGSTGTTQASSPHLYVCDDVVEEQAAND